MYPDRPDMRVHGYSDDDGCIDDGKQDVSHFELFVSVFRVTVDQETKRNPLCQIDFNFIKVVPGVVGP